MKVFILPFVFVSLVLTIFPQSDNKSDSQKLLNQILNFYKESNFDKAIPLAEQFLKLEKKSSEKNPQSLSTAHYNVALLRKKRFQITREKLNESDLDKDLRKDLIKKFEEDAERSEAEFREVIKIHEDHIKNPSKNDSLQLASTQNELAWILYNYQNYLFSSYKIENRNEEAEKLYLSAISSHENLLGKDADETLSVIFNLAEFYRKHIYFEKALPLYERFVNSVKNKYGEKNNILLPSLYSITEILITLGDTKQAQTFLDVISDIKGSKEKMPEANYVLNKRLVKGNGKTDDKSTIINLVDLGKLFDPNAVSFRGSLEREQRTKTIFVKVSVDENGEVTEATANTDDKDLGKEAESKVKDWKFKPFKLNGKSGKMQGYVIYEFTVIK